MLFNSQEFYSDQLSGLPTLKDLGVLQLRNIESVLNSETAFYKLHPYKEDTLELNKLPETPKEATF